jgi:sialidase-1
MTESDLHHVTVFEAGADGYAAYRIPAVETAPDGTLLAFAEGRKRNLGDPGCEGQEIDLVLKTSCDGGETWSDMRVIEAPGDYCSAGNPATVVDAETGRIWVHTMRCKPGANTSKARPLTDDALNIARWSDDNGATWSDPLDLTAIAQDTGDPQWRCTVPGPGGAIQDRNGRLVVPCWKTEPRENFVMVSADHGRTWERGGFVPGDIHGNENQVVELDDGRLLMDIRQSNGEHRWFSESSDGGVTWGMPRPGITVSPVACAIKRVPAAGGPDAQACIAWTGPRGPSRRDLVVRISQDQGRTFGTERLICESMAAYSDLTVLGDGALGVLWEKGKTSPYESLAFTRL